MPLKDYIPTYVSLDDDDFREHRLAAVIGATVGACIIGAIGFALANLLIADGAGAEVFGGHAAITAGSVSLAAALGAIVGMIMSVALAAGAIKPAVAATYLCALVGAVISTTVVPHPLDPLIRLNIALLAGTFIGAVGGATIGSRIFRDADMIKVVSASTIGQSLIAVVLFTFGGVLLGVMSGVIVGGIAGVITDIVMGAGLDFDTIMMGCVGGISVGVIAFPFLSLIQGVLIPLYEE